MTSLSTLLLVDPDPRGLETLTCGFEREGCAVTGTSDLDVARTTDLARRASPPPQVAVVSLREPEGRSLALVKFLRGSSARGLPVLTIGPPDLKSAALAAGAQDFLPTPLFVRDVICVGKLLALGVDAQETRDGQTETVVEVQSRLSEYHGLFFLLRAMAVTGRSGILSMNHGSKHAELRFSEGTLMSADVAGLQGLLAVHHVLLWDEAEVSFKFRAVARRTQLHMSAQELVDECERFMRDLAFSARDLGPPRTIYRQAPEKDARASGLQPSQAGPVLRLFDGHRTLATAIDESPFRPFDTMRVIKRLRDAGALVAEATAPVDGEPRSFLEPWAVLPDLRGVVGDRRRSQRKLKPVPAERLRETPAPIPLHNKKSGPTPIPLTVKKTTAVGEIAARKAHLTPAAAVPAPMPASTTAPMPAMQPPPAAVVASTPADALALPAAVIISTTPPAPEPLALAASADLGQAATVQVTVDGAGLPLAAPMIPSQPAPLTALEPRPRARARSRTPTPPPSVAELPEDAKARLKEVLAPARLTPSTAFDAVEADFFAREVDLYKREKVESFEDLDPAGTGGSPTAKRPPGKKG